MLVFLRPVINLSESKDWKNASPAIVVLGRVHDSVHDHAVDPVRVHGRCGGTYNAAI